jgi:hypothetical protein
MDGASAWGQVRSELGAGTRARTMGEGRASSSQEVGKLEVEHDQGRSRGGAPTMEEGDEGEREEGQVSNRENSHDQGRAGAMGGTELR